MHIPETEKPWYALTRSPSLFVYRGAQGGGRIKQLAVLRSLAATLHGKTTTYPLLYQLR